MEVPWDQKSDIIFWRSYKYLIGLDGISYSARSMALLASDSAVIKSTVYKEYFRIGCSHGMCSSFFVDIGALRTDVCVLKVALYTPLVVVF